MDLLDKLGQMVESIREDYNKAKGGNKAAGTRVRKAMQDIKNTAQEIRQEMLSSRESADS
ncbi:MAG: histone H1 [Phycisphaeraceae bacterium]|nr:MAG: histone H1 [Phycisphaeraceae bacterium]